MIMFIHLCCFVVSEVDSPPYDMSRPPTPIQQPCTVSAVIHPGPPSRVRTTASSMTSGPKYGGETKSGTGSKGAHLTQRDPVVERPSDTSSSSGTAHRPCVAQAWGMEGSSDSSAALAPVSALLIEPKHGTEQVQDGSVGQRSPSEECKGSKLQLNVDEAAFQSG